jgi:LmbE family N-acetylglucosaminyl deacetylase
MTQGKLNLTETEKIPLVSAETVADWGKTLVVAPHPDDESLGCGGAIALLRQFEREVCILTLSDGTLSHPNSRKYPKEKLRDLRENELKDAAEILSVETSKITFFRYQDRSVPQADAAEFQAAVERCQKFLDEIKPQTILVPWRRDPHPDHHAAFQLIEKAKKKHHRIIEYPIWLYELAQAEDAPLENEVAAFRLDISSVVEIKQKAIRAHRSQITDLIDDDPHGFRLSEEVLGNFAHPFEIYLRGI